MTEERLTDAQNSFFFFFFFFFYYYYSYYYLIRLNNSSSEIDKSPSPGQVRSSPKMSEASSQDSEFNVFSVATKLEVKRLSEDFC